MHQEGLPIDDPGLSIRCKGDGRNQVMQVWVIAQIAGPGLQDPAATLLEDTDYDEDDRALIGLSSNLSFYGGARYALLDAWASHPGWMRGLEAHLLEVCRQRASQEQLLHITRHQPARPLAARVAGSGVARHSMWQSAGR